MLKVSGFLVKAANGSRLYGPFPTADDAADWITGKARNFASGLSIEVMYWPPEDAKPPSTS